MSDDSPVNIRNNGMVEIKDVTIKGCDSGKDGVWMNGGSFIMSGDSKIIGGGEYPNIFNHGIGTAENKTSIIAITGGTISGCNAGGFVQGPNSSFTKTGGTISAKYEAIYVDVYYPSTAYNRTNDLTVRENATENYAAKINSAGNGIAFKSGNWFVEP